MRRDSIHDFFFHKSDTRIIKDMIEMKIKQAKLSPAPVLSVSRQTKSSAAPPMMSYDPITVTFNNNLTAKWSAMNVEHGKQHYF